MPIDLILHTPGGLVLATHQIASALRNHPAKVTVIVPHYAMSGGMLLALAADEILLDDNAVMGPVDPQVGGYPALSLLKLVAEKNTADVEDEMFVLADVARTALAQTQAFIETLVADRMAPGQVKELITSLTGGRWTHDYPITAADVRALGLDVRDQLPGHVYALMDLYLQPRQVRLAVQYLPVPSTDRGEPVTGRIRR
jgi:ClpP class serine protease